MTTVQVRQSDPVADERRRWKALAVCLTAGFMTLLDTSIVIVALPSMERGLHAATADLSWVVSGYALTYGLVLVPAGRLGDLRGRRETFITGVALFTLASAACGLAPTGTWLVVFRLLQGMAGGLIAPQGSGLIQQMFKGAERARAFAAFGSVVAVSTAVGPLAGGLLIEASGSWRWVFYVNLPIGAAVIIAALRLLPRHAPRRDPREGFDVPGVLLLGAGALALMLPLVQEQAWSGRGKWALVPLAVLLLATFWAWEGRQLRRRRGPLLDLRLFRVRAFRLGALLSLAYFAGFTSVLFVYTLFLQITMGYSALAAGTAAMPFAVGSALAALAGGRLVGRYGRGLVVRGLSCVALGLVGVIVSVQLVPGRYVGWAAALPLLVAGIGSGLTVAPNTTLTLARVPVRRAGAAGGVLQTGQRIGSAAGIAAVGAVYFARLANHGRASGALQLGFLTSLLFILAALTLAVADMRDGSGTG
ncbi:MFS transporter [Streptomyces sp. V3I7]|uniref:MFS transporter n=1 Tax=Streptomyces sp. V3I7 TaxID=3042278 RepID=UPI00277F66E9|nr:MFS transporter [Streptomyces sp. V3I7]MDQ0989302.1 EmrB/QacA subfamily drug resistance transporter [Streptomyces sp. V3I7]